MLLRRLALASSPWGLLAASTPSPGARGLPSVAPADLLADDACAGADEGCSLSLRQLRGELRPTQEHIQERDPTSSSSCFVLAPEGTEVPFTPEDLALVRGYFLRNIDIEASGAVTASPDHNTPGGSYFFHWERDAALSMHALLFTSGLTPEVTSYFKHYIHWVAKVQDQPAVHSGTDIRTEPKFVIPSGAPYQFGWCRPQTDGPGLRAKTLGEYALALVQQEADGKAFVLDHLWASNSSLDRKRPISWDLDWVVRNWRQAGCDIWEETTSDDFFWGRYTMRAGLHVGAELASVLGDREAHDQYVNTIQEIESTLIEDHWSGAFLDQCRISGGSRKEDSAVIEAVNVGDLGDDFLPVLSDYVLGTVISLNELFCSEYEINRDDSARGVPGVLYGRYGGDVYVGGNPWVLLSASLARLIYRQAAAVAASISPPSEDTYSLLQRAYGLPNGLEGAELGDVMVRAGDGVLVRVKSHLPSSMSMSEQLDRHTGKPIGAKDLTWNYANVLLAMQARDEYFAGREA